MQSWLVTLRLEKPYNQYRYQLKDTYSKGKMPWTPIKSRLTFTRNTYSMAPFFSNQAKKLPSVRPKLSFKSMASRHFYCTRRLSQLEQDSLSRLDPNSGYFVCFRKKRINFTQYFKDRHNALWKFHSGKKVLNMLMIRSNNRVVQFTKHAHAGNNGRTDN